MDKLADSVFRKLYEAPGNMAAGATGWFLNTSPGQMFLRRMLDKASTEGPEGKTGPTFGSKIMAKPSTRKAMKTAFSDWVQVPGNKARLVKNVGGAVGQVAGEKIQKAKEWMNDHPWLTSTLGAATIAIPLLLWKYLGSENSGEEEYDT